MMALAEAEETERAPNSRDTALTDGCYVTVITDFADPKFDLEAFLQAKFAENP